MRCLGCLVAAVLGGIASWALDLLDLDDERLVELGQPAATIHTGEAQVAKQKARAALAALDQGGTANG